MAKQTGGKLVEQAPPTETVVSDALSDEEVETKSRTIVGELASNGDYKVCDALIRRGRVVVCIFSRRVCMCTYVHLCLEAVVM